MDHHGRVLPTTNFASDDHRTAPFFLSDRAPDAVSCSPVARFRHQSCWILVLAQKLCKSPRSHPKE
jgi:hypothetical protein